MSSEKTYYSNMMPVKYFVNINPPQTFVMNQQNLVFYAVCIHWQLHMFDANNKEIALPLQESPENDIKSHIEIGVNSSSGQPIAAGRTSNDPKSGTFRFHADPGREYVLWIRHYTGGVITYTKAGKLTAAVRSYTK